MPTPPQDWVETALKVTGHFEDSADPMGAVSGDFDGMGISLGVLQWNIGSGSLQPLVTPMGRAAVVQLMPNHGGELWSACTAPIAQGLAVVCGWQAGHTLSTAVYGELKAFTHSAAFVARQVAQAGRVAQTAFDAANAYAKADPAYNAPTKALFAWFFDVFTQNGGLKGLGYPDVRAFVTGHGGGAGSDDAICDWLAALPSSVAGARDASKNAAAWRDAVPADRLSLFVLSYLRAMRARPEWRADTLNRKATVALWTGTVHGERHDLSNLLTG